MRFPASSYPFSQKMHCFLTVAVLFGVGITSLWGQQSRIQGAKGIYGSAGVSYRAIRAYLQAPKQIHVVAHAKQIHKQKALQNSVIVVHSPQAVLDELLQIKQPKTRLLR